MYALRTCRLVIVAQLAAGLGVMAAYAGDDPDASYAVAKEAYDDQQWQAAADRLQAYLECHADHNHAAEAHFFLAETLVQLRRYDEARQMYERYLQLPAGVMFAGFARYRLGETAYLREDYDRAAVKFTEFVNLHPAHEFTANASRYLGEIALSRRDGQAAADWFRQAMRAARSGPASTSLLPSIRFGYARAMELNDVAAARRLYDELIRDFPGPFAARAQLYAGMMEHRNGRTNPPNVVGLHAAQRRFETFLADYPDDENGTLARYWLGRTLLELGDYDAATREFVTAIHAAPVHDLAADLHFLAGVSLSRAGKLTAAEGYYEDVCKNWPDSPFATGAKAWLAARNRNPTAERDLTARRQATITPPVDASEVSTVNESPAFAVQIRRAYKLVEDQQLPAAADVLDALLQAPQADDEYDLGRVAYVRGLLAMQERQWDIVAKTMCRAAVAAEDNAVRLAASFWSAEAHFRQNDLEAAERQFNSLRETRAFPASWLGVIPLRLAQIRFRRGDIDGALELLESLARTCPNFCQQHEADFLCGCCYAAQGKLPAARTAFGRAIRSPRGATTETAAWAQWMIADTHQQEENYQQAIREFLRVSVLYDEFPQWQASALIHAGRCFERLGDERSAAKTYAQLRERFGGTGLANAADARRKSLRIQKPQCVATSDSAVTVLVSKQPG